MLETKGLCDRRTGRSSNCSGESMTRVVHRARDTAPATLRGDQDRKSQPSLAIHYLSYLPKKAPWPPEALWVSSPTNWSPEVKWLVLARPWAQMQYFLPKKIIKRKTKGVPPWRLQGQPGASRHMKAIWKETNEITNSHPTRPRALGCH